MGELERDRRGSVGEGKSALLITPYLLFNPFPSIFIIFMTVLIVLAVIIIIVIVIDNSTLIAFS